MDKASYGRFPKKRILVTDLAACVAAWFIALFIRYDNWVDRFDPLYIGLVIFACMAHALVYLVIDMRRKPVYVMDPIENAVAVIRNCTIVIVLTVLYLYVTQRGESSSRFVIGMMYMLDVIAEYILRMFIRRGFLKGYIAADASAAIELTYPYPGDISELDRLMAVSNGDHGSSVLIRKGSASDEEFMRAVDMCTAAGLRTYAELGIPGYAVKAGIACDVNGRTSVPVDIRTDRFTVFGVNYAISRTEEAVLHVVRHLKDLSGRYICFSNTHTLVMAREDDKYRDVLNGSAITFADGNPIAQLQIKSGLTGVERVAGPDFMEHMFRNSAECGVSHYFYGASPETLESLKKNLEEKYTGIDIRGMYSPPYRELTDREDEDDVRRINESGADIVWIGLGAPKQERWMADHAGRINGVMMGVGAGFDFHAGTIRRAPVWMQKVGLEWLYRLCQDPGRLFKRYVVTNCKFYIYRFAEMISSRGNRNRNGSGDRSTHGKE